MSDVRMDRSLRQISYNSTVLNEQMDQLRKDLTNGIKKLTTVTQSLDKTYRPPEVGEWRIVPTYNENDYRPQVKYSVGDLKTVGEATTMGEMAATADLTMKKLNIL